MKKLLLLSVFLVAGGLTAVHAQCHGANASASTEAKAETVDLTAASKAASLDESIIERTDASTGQVMFVRKEVCPTSGKISYKDVQYSAESGSFINVAPSDKASCAGKASSGKSGCCSSKKVSASATKTGASCAGKSATAGKSGCCSSKKAEGAGA